VDGTNPIGNDQPLPPDQLGVTPAHLSFAADLAQDVPMPQQQLHVTSRSAVTWTLSADVPWLSATAATGTTPDATTIVVRAFELDEGVHTATLTVTSAALSDRLTLPVAVTVTNRSAFYDVGADGWLDVSDVQSVAARIPSDNSQATFSHRYDVDRDGDVDGDDTMQMADRWMTDGRCCNPATANASAVVEVVAPDNAVVGQQVTVTLHIDQAQDLGGFEGTLHFDPELLAPVAVEAGNLLGSSGRVTAMLGPVGAPDGASLRLGAYTTGSASGPEGEGVLAQIVFQLIGAGQSPLALEQVLLVDTAGAASVPALTDAEIEVLEDGSTEQFEIFLPLILR
jgi:hypothetical protein